jgi:hypothetical protein
LYHCICRLGVRRQGCWEMLQARPSACGTPLCMRHALHFRAAKLQPQLHDIYGYTWTRPIDFLVALQLCRRISGTFLAPTQVLILHNLRRQAINTDAPMREMSENSEQACQGQQRSRLKSEVRFPPFVAGSFGVPGPDVANQVSVLRRPSLNTLSMLELTGLFELCRFTPS